MSKRRLLGRYFLVGFSTTTSNTYCNGQISALLFLNYSGYSVQGDMTTDEDAEAFLAGVNSSESLKTVM